MTPHALVLALALPLHVPGDVLLPLHVPGDVPPPLDLRLALAALAGLLAALAAAAAMRLQSYGYVPAYVGAAALWGRTPASVSRSAADATLLATGMLAGLLFEALVVGSERLRTAFGLEVEVVVADLTTVAELVALAAVVGVLYAGFSRAVFPRHGGSAYETRPGTVRRQWAVSAVVYGAGLFVALKVVYNVLPV